MLVGHDNFTLSKVDTSGRISHIKILVNIPPHLKTVTPRIGDINIDKSELLISSHNGLYYLNNKNEVTIVTNLRGMATAKWFDDTFVVAGAYRGLLSFSRNLIGKYKLNNADPKLNVYREIYDKFNIKWLYKHRTNCLYREEEGKLWAGLDNGLICLKRDTIINFHELYPDLRQRIVDIKSDSLGTVYLATSDNGVIIFKKNGEIMSLSKKQGLASNKCNKIELYKNVLWVGTNMGLNRITLNKNYEPVKIYTINTSYGLLSNHINALLVHNEKVWIGTSNGLSVINTDIEDLEERSPPIYITDITANNQAIDTLTKKEFHYEENNIRISYVGLFYKQGNINYKYRLSQGDDYAAKELNLWLETRNTSVDFSSLAPGNYSFDVMAQSTNGVWSKPATYKLVINAPFWKTKLFVILITIVSTLLAITLWWYGRKIQKKKTFDKRQLQLAELKTLRSQMNYHFMSNAFNSLQGLFFSENGIDQYIGKFSKLMRSTLEYSDRHQISLSEELDYLKLYWDIEQLRIGSRFSFNILCDESMNISKLLIPSLILQPFLENAIWHGIMPKEGTGTITLKILPNDAYSYKIVIEDDGIGFKASLSRKVKTSRKSFGTRIIMDRFDVIKQQSKNNFKIVIEDKADTQKTSGTCITITLPNSYEE